MLHIHPGLAGLSDLCSETQADGAKQPPFQTLPVVIAEGQREIMVGIGCLA